VDKGEQKVNREETVAGLEEAISILEATRIGDGPKENFLALTGLSGDLPPLLSAHLADKNGVTVEDFTQPIANMTYDILLLGVALGYAHGKKVSQTEATADAKAASNSAQ